MLDSIVMQKQTHKHTSFQKLNVMSLKTMNFCSLHSKQNLDFSSLEIDQYNKQNIGSIEPVSLTMVYGHINHKALSPT